MSIMAGDDECWRRTSRDVGRAITLRHMANFDSTEDDYYQVQCPLRKPVADIRFSSQLLGHWVTDRQQVRTVGSSPACWPGVRLDSRTWALALCVPSTPHGVTKLLAVSEAAVDTSGVEVVELLTNSARVRMIFYTVATGMGR